MLRFSPTVLLFTLLSVALNGCVVFSEMQSAKMIGKGGVEVTAANSSIHYVDTYYSDDHKSHAEDHVQYQLGIGLSDNYDLRFRYVEIALDPEFVGNSYKATAVGIGIKRSIIKDQIAFYLPVGYLTDNGLPSSTSRLINLAEADSWQVHPTFLFTQTFKNQIELNGSVKVIIPLTDPQRKVEYSANLGLGLSTNLNRYVIRHEIGWLFDFSTDWHYRHLSLGLTLRLN